MEAGGGGGRKEKRERKQAILHLVLDIYLTIQKSATVALTVIKL